MGLLNLIPEPYRLAALLAAAVAIAGGSFFAGWTVQDWRKGTEIATLKRDHEKQLADIRDAAAEAKARADAEALERQKTHALIDRDYLGRLIDAEKEAARLAAGIANGDFRVYVRAACPSSAGVPGAADGGAGGDGARAELTAGSRQAYLDLRAGIIRTEAKLSTVQSHLKACLSERQAIPGE